MNKVLGTNHYCRLLLAPALLFILAACSGDASERVATQQGATAANESMPTGYRRINTDNPADPLDAHIYELDNGLQVYLTENHEEPRFYAEIAVKAGSKHDPADGTGLAHYLEHLLFKGNQHMGSLDYAAEKPLLDEIVDLYEQHHNETDSERRAEIYARINSVAQQAAEFAVPGEFDKVYNAMGSSSLNAHTSYEETVYKVGLPSNRLAQWAEVESDRFVNPVFRLFHTELETVYEEKNRSMDNAGRVIFEAMDDLLFKVHPYGQQPTIGTTEHLKNPSLVYIRNYFDTYYVPNNMAIFISGDIEIEATIALISEKFAHWQRKEVPQVGPWEEAPIEGVERRTVQFPGEEQVQIAFRTVANNSSEVEALTMVDMI
ncbi:MAG: peptidase M16, partial [SAR86 cluster bacterium]